MLCAAPLGNRITTNSPVMGNFGKAFTRKRSRVVQGTHLIDTGVRDVVFLEKGIKTRRVTICSPPAVPQNHSPAPPSPGSCAAPEHPAPSARRWRRAMLTSPGNGATALPGDTAPGPLPARGLQGSSAAGQVPFQRGPQYRWKLLSSAAEPDCFTQLTAEIHRFGHKAGLGIYRHHSLIFAIQSVPSFQIAFKSFLVL